MDDIISLIVVFIIYSAIFGKKKAKKKRRGAGFPQMNLPEINLPQSGKRTVQPHEQKSVQRTQPEEIKRESTAQKSDAVCHGTKRMHVHEVQNAQLHMAGEGEDPCHPGDAREADLIDEIGEIGADDAIGTADPIGDSAIYTHESDERKQALAQDMLRGVIMSEILKRPCERRVVHGNRRDA